MFTQSDLKYKKIVTYYFFLHAKCQYLSKNKMADFHIFTVSTSTADDSDSVYYQTDDSDSKNDKWSHATISPIK